MLSLSSRFWLVMCGINFLSTVLSATVHNLPYTLLGMFMVVFSWKFADYHISKDEERIKAREEV